MNTAEILRIRLHNQLLGGSCFKEPHEVVAYMGAIQSQAFDMARWAIGARLPEITDRMVVDALNEAKVIRTHILRPTWHFVAAEDIHWMSDLSMPRLRPIYISYSRLAGAGEDDFKRHWAHVERILRDDNHLTRQELAAHLAREGKEVSDNAIKQILNFAELESLVCNGRVKGNKQTFCLLQEWVPKKQPLSKEESLEKLARKFFTSHAPAILQDFIWWSGLTITDCRKAVALIEGDFVNETINNRVFFMKNDLQMPGISEDSALLLPQFDEMVVSYKDRSEMIADHHYGKVMTKNGLFSPTVMWNGEIIGSWRKVMVKKKPDVEISFFEKTPRKIQNLYKKAGKAYLEFLTDKHN